MRVILLSLRRRMKNKQFLKFEISSKKNIAKYENSVEVWIAFLDW